MRRRMLVRVCLLALTATATLLAVPRHAWAQG